jgi:hypothetical protein
MSFSLNNGEMLIFKQCRSEFGVQIDFYGNGSLLVINSTFYYNLYNDFLDITITSSTVAFTEIKGNSRALLINSTFQHYLADGDTTSKLFHCNPRNLHTSYPDGSGYLLTMIKASGWAKIIMMGDESELFVNGFEAAWPAGIIWYIRNPWESEDPQVPILDGNVLMDFYVEGFNPHSTSHPDNVTVQLYVDDTVDQEFEVYSHNETWQNWYIESHLDITTYPLGNHTLKLFVNGSLTHNWVYLPAEFVNIHQISLPQFVYPKTSWDTLSGTVNVVWQPSLDSHNHDLTYSLYVQRLGYSWQPIMENLTHTTFEWDTTPFVDDVYQLKVVVECTEGLIGESELSPLFTIKNVGNGATSSTTLAPPTPWPEWTIRFGLVLGILVVLFVSLYFAKKRR